MDIQSSKPFLKRDHVHAISFFLVFLASVILFNFVDPFRTGSLLEKGGKRNSALSPPLPPPANCDYLDGEWVWDGSAPERTYTEECRFLDPGFRCRRNGRNDSDYLKWRWQPRDCDLPTFNASNMLERSRNARIVFAGDSIGRNQWESLVCMLAGGAPNQSAIYEQNGNPITKHKGYLSIRFPDHNLTVEYYRVPFLGAVGRPPPGSPEPEVIRKAVRVDQLHWVSRRWAGANVLVFNAGHWWNRDKTVKMGVYFQEGEVLNMTMGVRVAFKKTLQTWERWLLQNLRSGEESHVFFRSYSPVHFRDGTWDDGGRCDLNTRPETNRSELEPEPWNNMYISQTVEEISKVRRELDVKFLNITYLTDFRKDGHPSKHREPGTQVPFVQDCSHWCLPGVPDTWNQLLYAHLLSKEYDTQKKRLEK